ncbi:hypothetical protein DACRYDRAFT_119791 [Dacryopinax primogenitus]|uniref:Uncharacterized protein n=1 Tax=Dacryopinax primogenitus (strain DJM 731) TaxID=1858805 RepID=M5FN84_DACPD|nr:uncharacterized protein DACRYDRAFT_119791 [Dacryopinax primogenitus]EJT97000.1 hypothetical protein DACRYDRAFT_119791 [Dacryopinax primogenitus]
MSSSSLSLTTITRPYAPCPANKMCASTTTLTATTSRAGLILVPSRSAWVRSVIVQRRYVTTSSEPSTVNNPPSNSSTGPTASSPSPANISDVRSSPYRRQIRLSIIHDPKPYYQQPGESQLPPPAHYQPHASQESWIQNARATWRFALRESDEQMERDRNSQSTSSKENERENENESEAKEKAAKERAAMEEADVRTKRLETERAELMRKARAMHASDNADMDQEGNWTTSPHMTWVDWAIVSGIIWGAIIWMTGKDLRDEVEKKRKKKVDEALEKERGRETKGEEQEVSQVEGRREKRERDGWEGTESEWTTDR